MQTQAGPSDVSLTDGNHDGAADDNIVGQQGQDADNQEVEGHDQDYCEWSDETLQKK